MRRTRQQELRRLGAEILTNRVRHKQYQALIDEMMSLQSKLRDEHKALCRDRDKVWKDPPDATYDAAE
jgi:hypothetical protein